MLHNFGGRPGMYGKLDTVATEPASSGAAGVGATMEDFSNDPVCYELLADVGWHGQIDLDDWLRTWVDARYGQVPGVVRAELLAAWQLLRRSVYASEGPGPSGAVMLRRPRLDGTLVPEPWYASETPRWTEVPEAVWQAWDHLAAAASSLGADQPAASSSLGADRPAAAASSLGADQLAAASSLGADRLAAAVSALGTDHAADPLGRDLTDVAYVAVSTLGNRAQQAAAHSYLTGDLTALRTAGDDLLATIDELERLLATRPEYLLGRWLAAARSWGRTDEERAYYEADARRLLTVWGPPTGPLTDYARRAWSGMLATFHRPRWHRWLEELTTSLTTAQDLTPPLFEAELRTFESEWVKSSTQHPTTPAGNTHPTAESLHTTWRPR